MKRPALLFLLPALFLVLASSAFADSLNFTATGTVGGQSYTLTFTEPTTTDNLSTTTAVTFTKGSLNITDPDATVTFFSSSDWGLMNVDLKSGGVNYHFEFYGSQDYSGPGTFTFLTGKFGLGGPGGDGWYTDSLSRGGTMLGNGQVVVTNPNAPTPTPEPGTFALLGSGLAGLAALRRKLLKA